MKTMILIAAAVIVITALFLPLLRSRKLSREEAKRAVRRNLITFGVLCLAAVVLPSAMAAGAADTAQAAKVVTSEGLAAGLGYLAAALVTGLAAIGAGIAVAAAAPAAIGAFSEDPKSFGKSLIFVALGEGVAIYGLLISILILNKI